MIWHKLTLILHQQNKETMNTTDFNTLSELFSSENSYNVLVDMISDLDLEFKAALAF